MIGRADQLRLLCLSAAAGNRHLEILRPLVAGCVLSLDLNPVDTALRRGSSNRHLLRVELQASGQPACRGRNIRLRIVRHTDIGHRFLQFEFRLRDAKRVKPVVIYRNEHRRHHIRLEPFRHGER